MTQSSSALRRASPLVWLACVALSLACGDPVGPNGVAFIRLRGVPESGQVFVGHFVTLFADLYGEDNKIVPGSKDFLGGIPVSWTNSDSDIAIVQGQRDFATVDGMAPGSVVIRATSDGKQAAVRLDVVPVPIIEVTVSPLSAEVYVGMTTQLHAAVVDSFGGGLFEPQVTWVSSAPSRATVNADGEVSGISTGTAAIKATFGGKSGTATITVLNPPAAIAPSWQGSR